MTLTNYFHMLRSQRLIMLLLEVQFDLRPIRFFSVFRSRDKQRIITAFSMRDRKFFSWGPSCVVNKINKHQQSCGRYIRIIAAELELILYSPPSGVPRRQYYYRRGVLRTPSMKMKTSEKQSRILSFVKNGAGFECFCRVFARSSCSDNDW